MDVVELHRRASEEFVRRVAAVHPDQWDRPTPCTDWDVRALVNHVVAEERWTVPLMAGQTIEDVGSSLDGDLLGDDPADAATHAAHAAQLAVTEPVLTGATVQLSYGPEQASEYAYQLATDHLMHGWDLAVALGHDPRMIADRVGNGFTDPQDELIGAFGRDPRWTQAHAAVALLGEAFGRGDVDAIMAQLTPDCVFESTSPAPDGTRFEGADAVREQWQRLFDETSEGKFETEESVVLGDRAVARWRFSWLEPDGRRGHVRGVDVLRLRDGKVAEKLSYVKG
jgi:uncharacterized protein (TIGR03086 family)